MKKAILILILLVSIGFVAFTKHTKPNTSSNVPTSTVSQNATSNLIYKEGNTIKTRVKIPDGYKRETTTKNSFAEYLQNYALKPYGAKIINYDGSLWYNQNGHIGILEIDVPKNGLQQCADALIRIRSEYLWNTNQQEKIGFNFTSGHYCSWVKYAEGYRPKINGNQVRFIKTKPKNYSKENFYNYLNLIFTYSGTLSLYNELPKINSVKNLKIGDMLIVGGTPGHVAMIADMVTNASGDKKFLFIQGYTPAQSVHVLKNTNLSPWYNLSINSEISIPGYTFNNSKFVRFKN